MKQNLCCILSPTMKCGFCDEAWCDTHYRALKEWPKEKCLVPNTSGTFQGNHYTMSYWDNDELRNQYQRKLKKGETVDGFDKWEG